MCGIIGVISQAEQIDQSLFIKMRDTLFHRGPDDSGYEIFEGGRVALGHRRLSIIDLSESGRQPMSNEIGSIWLTFNGEIYNYRELKDQLQSKGHIFKSESDSEVIVHGYEEWGESVVTRLKGMFAFAIWDDNKKKLFLARDRFGIKPLYCYFNDGKFIFSSEIKGIVCDPSIPRQIDFNALADFLVYRFIPSPKSIWHNVFKLPPAHSLSISLADFNIDVNRYWEISPLNHQQPLAEVSERAGSLLESSVKMHLQSDVPVGVFLSGGFDSSAIVHYMHRLGYDLNTFSIGFKDSDYSEHLSARIVSKLFNTWHSEKLIGEEAIDLTEDLAYFYDEPIGGSSFMPTYVVSKLASERVKVVMAGDGGDEVFAGYNWHKKIFDFSRDHSDMNLKSPNNQLSLSDLYGQMMSWGGFSYSHLKDLFDDAAFCDLSRNDNWLYKTYLDHKYGPVKSFQILDYHCFLPEVVLAKVDRASMANSLEVRVPFLDHELTEFMMQLDESVYFEPGVNKKILHELIKPYFPNSILSKPKKGFGAPVSQYQKKRNIGDEVLHGQAVRDKIFKRSKVEAYIERKEFRKLWPLFVFEKWYKMWASKMPVSPNIVLN